MYGCSCDKGRFMENFRFDTIYKITQEPQQLQKYNCKSGVIKCLQLSSKVKRIKGKSRFDQLAAAFFSTSR